MTRALEEQLIDAYADDRCPDPDSNHENGCTAALEAKQFIQQIKATAWDQGHDHKLGRTYCDCKNPYRSQL